jgi:hypothetical protein
MRGCASKPLAQFDGPLTTRLPGWTFLDSAGDGKPVYLPFEGIHSNKGGRLQSPVLKLDKSRGANAYYELRFSAEAGGPSYWWVDFFDRERRPLPDCNSAIEPGAARDYVELFVAPPQATSFQLAFVSAAGVQARDLTLRRIDAAAAAAWCDRVYAELPPLHFTAPADALRLLPRTAAALRDGHPFAVVMLGDSIVNDLYTSGFEALLQRDYPASRFRFVISVRGSTGCLFYRDPAQFEQYVARHRPDLLLVGGISNGHTPDARTALSAVISQARAAGMEVLLTSPPHSREWDTGTGAPPLTADTDPGGGIMRLRDLALQRELAASQNVAFFDLTTPCVEYFGNARQPAGYFNRDAVHNNDRGKQIIGRILRAYFHAGT